MFNIQLYKRYVPIQREFLRHEFVESNLWLVYQSFGVYGEVEGVMQEFVFFFEELNQPNQQLIEVECSQYFLLECSHTRLLLIAYLQLYTLSNIMKP